jgi:hypothetical protein
MTTKPDALKDLTLLADICDEFLGMTFAVARRKFSLGTLPLKAFRLTDTRRGPIYVHNDDLEAHVRKRRTRAPAVEEVTHA